MSPLQDRLHNSLVARSGRAGSPQRGFSLMELMITLAIVMILAGVTFFGLQPALRQARVTNAYDTTLMTLRYYRQQSIALRQRYIVTFTAPGTITVSYWGVGVPVSPAPVVVQTIQLPADVQYAVQAGLPTANNQVPDGFGTGATAIDFDQGVGLGSQNYVMFMPDGSSQDTVGNLNSGVIYLGRPNEIESWRAVTVFGSTGRIRGWRLVRLAGVLTWQEQ
jgi:prepilin-type N-terminal cleavage/methylation domain-containing protein